MLTTTAVSNRVIQMCLHLQPARLLAFPGLADPPGTVGLCGARAPWTPGRPSKPPLPIMLCLLFADFNENGFIDEEDLQRIVLRLLNSDDVSEDLLTDLTNHVCSPGPHRLGWAGPSPKAPGWQAG